MVAQVSAAHRCRAAGVHRRDVDEDQHGAAQGLEPEGRTAPGQRAAWPLENHDLPRRLALRRHHRALRVRRPDQRRKFPALCRTDFGSESQAPRCRHHGQSRQPQGQCRQSPNQGCRRAPAVPAATSTRSSSCSPNSSTCCARPKSARSRPPGGALEHSSPASPPMNAGTTSVTPDTGQCRVMTL
jgi:hypothetical protein